MLMPGNGFAGGRVCAVVVLDVQPVKRQAPKRAATPDIEQAIFFIFSLLIIPSSEDRPVILGKASRSEYGPVLLLPQDSGPRVVFRSPSWRSGNQPDDSGRTDRKSDHSGCVKCELLLVKRQRRSDHRNQSRGSERTQGGVKDAQSPEQQFCALLLPLELADVPLVTGSPGFEGRDLRRYDPRPVHHAGETVGGAQSGN